MMYCRWLCPALVLVTSVITSGCSAQEATDSGRLKFPPSYMIVAPKVVRADQVVQVYISIFQLRYPYLNIRSAIRRNGEELASSLESFTGTSTRLTQLQMPQTTEPGNYTLLVEGLVDHRNNQPIFRNETKLIFHSKRVSAFIITDRVVYQKRMTVNFRVVAVHPNLLPVTSGSFDLYVKDAAGQIVRRWLALQVNHGFYESSFRTGHPVKLGWWTIEVHAWGHVYRKSIQFINYFWTRHEQQIRMPTYVMENEAAIEGVVETLFTQTPMPVHGNATVEVEIQPDSGSNDLPRVKKTYPMVDGVFGFHVPLSELRNVTGGKIAGSDVYVHARVNDWNGKEEVSYKSYLRVLEKGFHLRFMGGKVRTFKPFQPLIVHMVIYSRDGRPMTSSFNRLVRVQTVVRTLTGSTQQTEKSHVLGDDSMIHYSYIPQRDDVLIKVRAAYIDGTQNNYKELTAYRHHTASNHYLYLTTQSYEAKLDTYIVFTVRLSTYIPELHYQVVAGSNIVATNQLFMTAQQKTFALAVSRDMMPSARIIVWGLHTSGEVLADSMSFHVDGVTSQDFQLRINKGKDFSGDTVEVNAFTSPMALTAFSVELEDMINMGIKPSFNKYEVEEDLLSYDVQTNGSFKHTWHDGNFGLDNLFLPAPSYAIDPNTTFDFAGLLVFTDAVLTRIEAARTCNHTLGYLPCYDGGCFRSEDMCDGVRQCEDGADEMGCKEWDTVEVEIPDTFNKTERRWGDFDDDKLFGWKNFYTKPSGRIDFPIEMPLYPDLWYMSGFSLDRDRGLAFTTQPVEFSTARGFLVMLEVQSRAVKGEQLGLQVSAFNKRKQHMEVIITLVGSDDYRFVQVEHGIISSYNPRTISGDIQTMVYMRPGESRYIHFPVLPVRSGSVKFSVTAQSFTNSQTVSKSVNVRMDGVTNHWNTPMLLDLVSTGSAQIPYLHIPVPERFIDPGQREHLYVPGSAQATVSIVGDVVGPGFFTEHLDARNTLRMVYGNGEHYIYNMATNLHWLKFLKATNQLSQATLMKGLDGINLDLQEVYAYIQDDGGFRNRRNRPPADTWQTALALEVLIEANEPEWVHTLFVDQAVVDSLAGFIIAHQNLTSGCYWSPAPTYDIKNRGNQTDENGKPANISLTALATISLNMAQPRLTGDNRRDVGRAINLGIAYLSEHLMTLSDPYQICLVSYALHVTNHPSRTTAFNFMKSIQREGEFMYWSREPIPTNRLEFINGIPYQHPRDMPPPYQAEAVHATAYGLLVYLKNNRFVESEPIMKWLQSQRNHVAGFAASADSITALKALIEYGKRETNRHLHRLEVAVEATSSTGWDPLFSLNTSNFMIMHDVKVPEVWGAVKTVARGTGLALYQMSVSVNVEYPHQVRQPRIHAFDLEVEKLVFSGRNASLFEMNICIRWAATHISPTSGAAILEVDIPTGFFVRKQELRKYQRVGRIDSERSRYTSQKVVMYFEYIDSTRSCFYFPGERWYPVANASIQHNIIIYDSYEPALMNHTLYTTYTLFHLHMCQVCGSFQCPYCPHYNGTRHNRPSTTLIFILVIIMYIITLHEMLRGPCVLNT